MAPLTARDKSLVHPGMGQQVNSPQKQRRKQRVGEKAKLEVMGKAVRLQQLQQQLARLEAGRDVEEAASTSTDPFCAVRDVSTIAGENQCIEGEVVLSAATPDASQGDEQHPVGFVDRPQPSQNREKKSRHLDQEVRVARFFNRWQGIIPDMQQPLSEYLQETARQPTPASFRMRTSPCDNSDCFSSRREVIVLFWDRK